MTNKNSKKKMWIAIVVAIVLIKTAFLLYLIYSSVQPKDKGDGSQTKIEKSEPYFKEAVNVLVLGIDQRGNEKSRTDTIMVYRIDPINKEVRLLSIPRDTYVNIPGKGMDKINHAHAFGDIELAKKTVEEFLGIEIHHYARTNFDGFTKLIDIVGGVTIDVEKVIKSRNIQPGVQKLSSDEALAYVRDRNDRMGDIERVRRQQKFLKALVNEVGAFEPKWKLVSAMPSVYSNIKTDIPIKAGEELLSLMKQVDIEKSELEQVPGTFYNLNGVSYWKPNIEKTEELVAKIFRESTSVTTEEEEGKPAS